MSEFTEWVERSIGLSNLSYERSLELHRQIQAGIWPDPRGRLKAIWWRRFWPFDRRSLA